MIIFRILPVIWDSWQNVNPDLESEWTQDLHHLEESFNAKTPTQGIFGDFSEF